MALNHLKRPKPEPSAPIPAVTVPDGAPLVVASIVKAVNPSAFRCGHVVPFDLDCPSCVSRRRVEKKKAGHAKRIDRMGTAIHPANPHGRLPDLSAFAVWYDAAKQTWTGTLEVAGHPPFAASASGVFRLLQELDGMYRRDVP